jgi:hypothetical protein
MLVFYGEQLLSHHPVAKLENHLLFAICVFNIFTALPIPEGHLLSCNVRMYRAVVTRDRLKWKVHT